MRQMLVAVDLREILIHLRRVSTYKKNQSMISNWCVLAHALKFLFIKISIHVIRILCPYEFCGHEKYSTLFNQAYQCSL